MEVKAKAKYIKISPRKMRLVIDVVRGMDVNKALDQLKFIKKHATKPVEKLINSAVASAENDFELAKNNLFIKEIRVDEGVTLHRWMPRARGRATPIRKRTSHVSLILAELVESGKKEAKKKKIEAPVKLGSKPKEDEGVKIREKDEKEKSLNADKGEEKQKLIVDPRGEGKGKNTKIEGKGFAKKIFRRKSG